MAVPTLWWIALVLGLALLAIAAIALWQIRQDSLDGQARELGLLSLALTDELDRGLRGAEEGLRAIHVELHEGRLALTGPGTVQALRTRAELMPLVRTLWLVGREGESLSASDPTPVPELQSFSPALAALADDAAAVSPPVMDTSSDELLVSLAVRFTGTPGTASGWVIGGIPARALLGAFSVAAPAADTRMAIFRGDSVHVAGSTMAMPKIDETSLGKPRNTVLERDVDGRERLVALHDLPRYELKVVLTRDLEALLLAWREAALLTAMGIVLLLAVMVGSAYLLQRANRRHAEAERASQTQLARAGRLQSLGTLAGGVAHDFNNVLAGIIGYGEMAQDTAPVGSDLARHLDKMLQAALRGKALVERVLTFSRGGAHASQVFALEPLVEEVLTLLAASLRPGVVLEREFNARGGRLRGDPTQAFEAIMNLCTNALQAMPAGGMLSVQLVRLHVGTARVLSHSQVRAGDYLALSVSDQGAGITPDVMEHLFEPFFTTRDAHSGTGLGLAVVHGVVTEFGGAIDVQSTPEHGARFTLYLPECTETLASPEPSSKVLPRGAGQTLLVVDDEFELVDMTKALLSGLGYAVVGYSDPAAALHDLRGHPQRFAAVITDEVMPGLTGTRLTEALRAYAPHLPVLLISGYGGELLTSRAAAAGVTRVLAKPLQRAELARALADLLR